MYEECVSEREKERESACVCTYVCARMCGRVYMYMEVAKSGRGKENRR